MKRVLWLLILEIFILSGCTSVNSMRKAPQTGLSTEWVIGANEASSIVQSILASERINIKSVEALSNGDILIVGTKGMSLMSYGEVVKVYLEQGKNGKITFYVESKPKLSTNVFAEDHAPEILNKINLTIGLK